ncbi:hypothetical protein HK096_007317 [Nowakowskiella sp. JEL0078]|nr:hypothetical protein HK096_007317 [Nowakowskiella sp. JEL0078]
MSEKKVETIKENLQENDDDSKKKYTQHSFFSREIRAFLSGIMFFTRISVPRWVSHNNYWLGLSTLYFPLIGIIVGSFGALVFAIAFSIWRDAWIASVFYTMATVWITGAFHEDGLADMFDGFGGGWTRAAIFKIMRDPCVGSYAVVGFVLCQMLKLGSISKIASILLASALKDYEKTGNLINLTISCIMMVGPIQISGHVLGRWCCSYLLYQYPYVTDVSAAGKEFAMIVSTPRVILASVSAWVFVWVCCVFVGDNFSGISYLSPILGTFIRVYGTTWAITLYGGYYVNEKIGGVIGDCLGAINQIVEIATYLAFASAL